MNSIVFLSHYSNTLVLQHSSDASGSLLASETFEPKGGGLL
jgi:hypothetical protein